MLYKARAGGSFAYRGDDPSDYETSFRQLNKVGSQDLEPVMKLIKWANEASGKEFAEGLGRYVDVESFAKYVAAQNLLLNFDDMAGPGKNYLLWYDLDTRKFSVLGWDYNLTFSGDARTGPDDKMSMGGISGGGQAGDGASDQGRGQGQGGPPPEDGPERMPGGTQGGRGGRAEPPEGMPDGFPEILPDGKPPGGWDGKDKGQGRGGSGHTLKDRFLALDAFDGVYKKAYQELYETFYSSGVALKALENIAGQAREAGVEHEMSVPRSR